eukprot:CAMPEP_0171107692 /NCGR_PEP_ID=MMETSP0766_2-20121228/67381_1 /TAXON_ID=439317 /ORGANISM="Gambierdiscus australes, Strain CAWD 149" /LENGTH=243 /DNA_ID=CAMNT_0011569071 /DNA_START=21 /DNA_END=752 /DNA_ORIENTATION=+
MTRRRLTKGHCARDAEVLSCKFLVPRHHVGALLSRVPKTCQLEVSSIQETFPGTTDHVAILRGTQETLKKGFQQVLSQMKEVHGGPHQVMRHAQCQTQYLQQTRQGPRARALACLPAPPGLSLPLHLAHVVRKHPLPHETSISAPPGPNVPMPRILRQQSTEDAACGFEATRKKSTCKVPAAGIPIHQCRNFLGSVPTETCGSLTQKTGKVLRSCLIHRALWWDGQCCTGSRVSRQQQTMADR